jgi:hypothetical protein
MFLVALALCVAGFALRGAPADPDVAFTKAQEAGVFLISAWFVLCAGLWGRSLARALGLEACGPLGALALGSAFLSFAGMALGHLGLVGFGWQPLVLALLLAGPAVDAAARRGRPRAANAADWLPDPPWLRAVFAAGALALAGAFGGLVLRAALAHGTSDPFVYHLLGPRLWAEAGAIHLPERIPIVYQSAGWEMLILLSQTLLGGPGGLGLIEGHLFAQYLQVGLGVGGTLVALAHLGRSGDPGLDAWLPFALLGALCSSELTTTAALAKNDWGVFFWTLAAAGLLLKPRTRGRTEPAVAGALLGLACAAKPNMVFFAAPLIAAWLARLPAGRLTAGAPVLAAALAAALPNVVRNALATGNPAFPFVTGWTRTSLLSPAALRGYAGEPVLWQLDPGYSIRQAAWILRDSWAHAVLLAAPLLAPFLRGPLRTLAPVAAVSMLWLLCARIPNPFVRWAGPPLALPGLFAVAAAYGAASRLPWRPARAAAAALASLAFAVTAYRAIPFVSPGQVLDGPSPARVVREPGIHLGGDSKAWLRMNAVRGEPVYTTGDNTLYYLAGLEVRPGFDDPEVSRGTDRVFSLRSLVPVLRGFGFRYALDTDHWDKLHWGPEAYLLAGAQGAYPEAVAYAGPNSRVIDLAVLEQSLARACVARDQRRAQVSKGP